MIGTCCTRWASTKIPLVLPESSSSQPSPAQPEHGVDPRDPRVGHDDVCLGVPADAITGTRLKHPVRSLRTHIERQVARRNWPLDPHAPSVERFAPQENSRLGGTTAAARRIVAALPRNTPSRPVTDGRSGGLDPPGRPGRRADPIPGREWPGGPRPEKEREKLNSCPLGHPPGAGAPLRSALAPLDAMQARARRDRRSGRGVERRSSRGSRRLRGGLAGGGLPAGGADRAGRHGRRLPCPRSPAGPRRRAEDPGPGPGRGRRLPAALHPRVAGRRGGR